MKKLLTAIMSVLILVVLGSGGVLDKPAEVDAAPGKTKCIITADGGFFCEGNPGYEQAVSNAR